MADPPDGAAAEVATVATVATAVVTEEEIEEATEVATEEANEEAAEEAAEEATGEAAGRVAEEKCGEKTDGEMTKGFGSRTHRCRWCGELLGPVGGLLLQRRTAADPEDSLVGCRHPALAALRYPPPSSPWG